MITMAKKEHLLFAAVLAVAAVERVAAQQNPDLKWAQMHGWLMWVSFGFLFPLSLLLIRYSRPQRDPTATVAPGRVQLLFYLHVFLAVMGVVLASAGVAILIHRDGGDFDYTHQRLGLALMIIMWMMPFIGLLRPAKGVAARPYWFVLHWVFGTGAVFLGIVNCYIGIHVYQLIFQQNIRSLNIAFSCILAFMAVAYFFQDKWSYILKQRNSPDRSHVTRVKVSQIGLV
ncbi:unnamed protein product [Calypogeia fissa]